MIDREALITLLRTGLEAEELADLIIEASQERRAAVRVVDLTAEDRLRISALLALKSHSEGDCIIWTGPKGRQGYGIVKVQGQDRMSSTNAHKAAWILANGPITDPGLVLDHLCRNRACIRVEHLEPVTSQENTRRGAVMTPKTTCKRGHALAGDNVRLWKNPRTGYVSRVCRQCQLMYRQAAKTSPATAGK